MSQEKSEDLSPVVKGNVRYIESLKGKYLRDGLLGKILNLKMKKKIGVQFIEQDRTVKNSPEKGIDAIASPRLSNDLSKNSVSSDEESKNSMFEIMEEMPKSSEDSSDSSKSSSSYDPDNYNAPRINLPGVLVKKLDSKGNPSSETDEEFKRDTTPEHKLSTSPANKTNSFLKVSSNNIGFTKDNTSSKSQHQYFTKL